MEKNDLKKIALDLLIRPFGCLLYLKIELNQWLKTVLIGVSRDKEFGEFQLRFLNKNSGEILRDPEVIEQ